MIDVAEVLRGLPRFETFCSVEKLDGLVASLRDDPARFRVTVPGTSVGGRPIHHVQFGKGSVKALFVGFPHPNEPVGGLTTFSLLTLLKQHARELVDADVEWHVVPCIDPDGAMLNEGWSQRPFSFESYMKGFHRQELQHQVECSFPIRYKRLVFETPTREARILQGLLDSIRPDFYYSLHNNFGTGGAWFLLTRDIGQGYYRELHELLERNGVSLKSDMPYGEFCQQFAAGIKEPTPMWKYYDFLEKVMPAPEKVLQTGACSWDYLAQIKKSAVTLVAEVPYLRHPSDGSPKATSRNLRQLKLRIDAENKFVTTVILEEWARVEADLDRDSPFHRKIHTGIIAAKDDLNEGLVSWPMKTREVLFNANYSRDATEGECFDAYVLDRFIVLCHSHEFVRLLMASKQTEAVRQATRRVQSVLDEALADIDRNVDFSKFETIDCNALARVQLGSGLTVLNALLAAPLNVSSAQG